MMQARRRSTRLIATRARSSAGFLLAELLLYMAITGLLLAALGTAVYVWINDTRENQTSADLTQAARAVAYRISRDIRAADAVDANGNVLTIIPPANSNGLQLIQYEYAAGQLYYRRQVNSVLTSYVLLGSDVPISSFSLTKQTGADWLGLSCVTDVTVGLTLALKNQSLTVSASASPRRNQLY